MNQKNFWKEHSNGIICLLIAQYDDFISLNELIGSFKIDNDNKVTTLSKGKLLTLDEKNLIFYVEKQEKVKKKITSLIVYYL